MGKITERVKKAAAEKANVFGREDGYVLVMSVFVLVIMVIVGTMLIVVGVGEVELSSKTKSIEKVYELAEAGISRAIVEARLNPDILDPGQVSGHVYNTPLNTPQFTAREDFGDGYYVVELWQDDRAWDWNDPYNSDVNRKVIKSTGFYKAGRNRVSRTLEMRVKIDVWSEEYDASFDYLIFNNDTRGASGRDPWPKSTFYLGNFVWDAKTAYSSGGEYRRPKGAIYTKGNMDLINFIGGKLKVLGNIVASGDIRLANTVGLHGGVDIDGNVVAGARPNWEQATQSTVQFLDGVESNGARLGAGDVELKVIADPNVTDHGIRVNGLIAAARDIKIKTWGATGIQSAVKVGGLRAGRDIEFPAAANFNINWPVEVGKLSGITCGRDFDATSTFLGGLDLGDVWAGDDVSFTVNFSPDRIGNIKAYDKVTLSANQFGTIRSGAVEAGAGGVELKKGGYVISTSEFRINQKNGSSITSLGDIVLSGSGWSLDYFNVTTEGSILCGSNINIDGQTGGSWSTLNLKRSVRAKGSITLKTNQGIDIGHDAGISVISENSSVEISTNGFITGGIKISGDVLARGNINLFADTGFLGVNTYLQVSGGVRSHQGNINVESAGLISPSNWVLKGLWAGGNASAKISQSWFAFSTKMTIGRIVNDDSAIRAVGNIILRPNPFWPAHWPWEEPPDNMILNGNARYGGIYDANPANRVGYASGYGPISSSVSPPSAPTVPQVTAPAPPTLGSGGDIDILQAADLESPVKFPEPNWGFFYKQAYNDDEANPSAPHLLEDGGRGDEDGQVNGQILFKWDSSKPYSPNETVFSPNPAVVLKIKALDWSDEGADFKGTIVARGNILLDSASTNFFLDRRQTLNIITGGGFFWENAGLSLTLSEECNFHIYASREIDLHSAVFNFWGTNRIIRGSFAAGWYVLFYRYDLFTDLLWQWARFDIDPEAWMPQYRVYSLREVPEPAKTSW